MGINSGCRAKSTCLCTCRPHHREPHSPRSCGISSTHKPPRTPNCSVHFHFSPPTENRFFLQRKHPANCIFLPPKMNLGVTSRVPYMFFVFFPLSFSIWFQFMVIFSRVPTRGVVSKSGRSRGGIKSPAAFSSIKCLSPAKKAHVNRFHSKPHSVLPRAQGRALTLSLQFHKASFSIFIHF